MTLANIVRLTIYTVDYTVDVDTLLQNFDVLGARLGAAEVKPAQMLLGVTRLAFPELLIELEATAMA